MPVGGWLTDGDSPGKELREERRAPVPTATLVQGFRHNDFQLHFILIPTRRRFKGRFRRSPNREQRINRTWKPRRTVFVTVGTTCFDALVQAFDTTEVKEELFRKGYTDLLNQMGRGSYVPMKVVRLDKELELMTQNLQSTIHMYLCTKSGLSSFSFQPLSAVLRCVRIWKLCPDFVRI
ncbi:hypothetical protein Vadar_033037 [Vaccinium darrowii]|uniref:Uncharacterized protein n=1 Tax=Vaccinium darrowii TaxID=229202 RepID=A0ACB7ZPB3_9ERIC|nr:hypothetical protein Vadar_033037 [Vaccinium darrowii]